MHCFHLSLDILIKKRILRNEWIRHHAKLRLPSWGSTYWSWGITSGVLYGAPWFGQRTLWIPCADSWGPPWVEIASKCQSKLSSGEDPILTLDFFITAYLTRHPYCVCDGFHGSNDVLDPRWCESARWSNVTIKKKKKKLNQEAQNKSDDKQSC